MSATVRDTADLLGADPVALTQREMLLRLDARLDGYQKDTNDRFRPIEEWKTGIDAERRTLKAVFVTAMAVWPILTFVLVNVVLASPK